jgi:tetratricopeptide (TPR) repeat protein
MHDIEFELVFDKAKIFRFMLIDLSLILPFCLLGAFLSLKDFKKTSLLYLVLIAQSFGIVLFFVTSRYRQVMVPFLIIFAASGVIYLWDALRQKKYLRLGWLCVILVLLFLVFGNRASGKSKFGYFEDKYLDFRYHLGKAMEYNDKADYKNALKEAEEAYRLQPNHYTLLSYGTIYYNMKDYKMAEEKFKEAIKAFPLTVDAYYDLGLLYNEQKRYAEAKEMLIMALSLNPEDIGAHFELGKAFKATGDMEEARREFNIVLRKISRWRAEEKAIITKELADLEK